MHPRQRRQIIVGAAIALLAVLAVTLYFTIWYGGSGDATRGVASDEKKTISVNGVDLAAEVLTPRGATKPPLIVLPGSFGGSPAATHQVSVLFARSGYVVVSYAQRGFGGSTGKVDFGGPATQQDASDVITWALRNTHADPKRIGMLGFSYGAGISLLTAAHDPRVKAVAALSTWTDLANTYTDIGTPHTNALRSIIGDKHDASDYDATTRRLQTVLLDHPGDLGAMLKTISGVRSPDNYVKQLNKNKPAIMIANAFSDSLFGPSQLIAFFSALHGPKRLELAPGDHGGPERTALEGGSNEVISDVRAWFDHYLRGVPNNINREDPIVVKDGRTGELRTFKTWPASTKRDCLPLPAPDNDTNSSSPTNWIATVKADSDSGSNSAPIELVPSAAYQPQVMKIATVNQKAGLVWNGPPLSNGLQIAGTPRLKLNIAATTRTATIYLYLYDVTSDGVGTLIDFQPYTATNFKAVATPHTIALQPLSWTAPPGDRLTLVIDTADPRYLSLTKPGTTITFTSNKKDTSTFCAPAGR